MGLETVTYVGDLVVTNPVSNDLRSQGDDHLRNLKVGLRNTFPNGDRAQYFARFSAKTSDFVVAATDMEKAYTCDCTADHIDVTLPALGTGNDAWAARFIKIDASANLVRIAGTINGDADGFNLTKQWQSVVIMWTGSAWIALHEIRIVDQVPTLDSLSVLGAATIAGLLTLSSTSYMFPPRGTTAQRPGADLPAAFRYNTDLDLPEWQDSGDQWRQPSIAQPTRGSFSNLVIINNTGTPNSQVDIDADYVHVHNPTTGLVYELAGINLTIDATTNGANGLDAGGLANNTWYFRYVIYNPTTNTIAGLLSTSATAPTMPSGYTARAKMPGAMRTNGSAQLHRVTTKGARSQHIISASVTTILPLIASGAGIGTYDHIAPTYSAQSVSSVVPSTATFIGIIGATSYNNGTRADVYVAPNTSYTGIAGTKPPPIAMNIAAQQMLSSAWFMLESTNVAVVSDGAGGAVMCLGWEDPI